MATGLLFEQDEQVAAWLFTVYKQQPMRFDRALGLISPEGALTGAVLFHNWNGANVELSYYGRHTLTAGIARCIARFAICTFDPSRVTVMTSKRNKHFMRSLQRFGFRVEGAQRCHYGKRDCIRNVGVRFAMFRERIEELAKLNPVIDKAVRC